MNTAVINIRNSLHDPFPSTAKTTTPLDKALTVEADEPKVQPKKAEPTTTKTASESRSGKKDSDRRTVTSQTSATSADVERPAKHERKVHDPASSTDGHPENRPHAKARQPTRVSGTTL